MQIVGTAPVGATRGHSMSSARTQSHSSNGSGGGGAASSRHSNEDTVVDNGGVPPLVQALGACVKIFCTSVAPCYALPWVRGEESHATGSGFAALLPSGERRILVHAQVLENHTLVQVRRVSEAQKYVAQVEVIGFDVDVGVLRVEDDAFWSMMPLLPLPMGLPQPMSEVITAGFLAGGEELSTTRGVVNRIMLGGMSRELCVQMDAAINPSNSGGPILNSQGQVVGMASSGSQHAPGLIIPLPVIHTFLEVRALPAPTPPQPSAPPLSLTDSNWRISRSHPHPTRTRALRPRLASHTSASPSTITACSRSRTPSCACTSAYRRARRRARKVA